MFLLRSHGQSFLSSMLVKSKCATGGIKHRQEKNSRDDDEPVRPTEADLCASELSDHHSQANQGPYSGILPKTPYDDRKKCPV